MNRALKAAYWVTPIVFCLLLYWRGLRIWFAMDDFAWLSLRSHVVDFRTFLWAMFSPLAQGTVRPFSERGFFMVFSYFFGLRALPYRAFVFLNQFVNIVLVMLMTRKLTKSDLAAFLAPLLWLVNVALIIPMSWSASYNEIQCAIVSAAQFLFVHPLHGNRRKEILLGAMRDFPAGLRRAGDQRGLSGDCRALCVAVRTPLFSVHAAAVRRLCCFCCHRSVGRFADREFLLRHGFSPRRRGLDAGSVLEYSVGSLDLRTAARLAACGDFGGRRAAGGCDRGLRSVADLEAPLPAVVFGRAGSSSSWGRCCRCIIT